MLNLLKVYQRKLTNLTAANRSLVLLKLTAENDLDFQSLDFTDGKPAYQLLQEIVKGKKEIKLCDYLDSRDKHVNELSKKLSKLHKKDALITEERGSKDLYLGYPVLRGKLNDGTIVRCPLLFFPLDISLVQYSSGKAYWRLMTRDDALPSFNKSFLLAFSHYNKVNLGDELLDFNFEDPFEDLVSFKNYLYEFLKKSPLEINFNSDLYKNELEGFAGLTKADLENDYQNGELKLFPEAVLGFFPQSGSFLVPDYEEMSGSLSQHSLEDFFLSKSFSDSKQFEREENLLTPFPIDASQERAINLIKSGNSLVVQGPPGTGKSQLICNLICDYIARGKKVLVVCQKKAALDVVFERLAEKHIEGFVGLVHDFRNDRKKLYDQLAGQIEKVDDYKVQNGSLDAIWLEREFLQVSRKIDRISSSLDRFRNLLFDESLFGVSPKELYLLSDISLPLLDIKDEALLFKKDSLESLVVKFANLFPYGSKFENPEFKWKNRVSFRNYTLTDRSTLEAVINAFRADVGNIEETVFNFTGIKVSYFQLLEINREVEKWLQVRKLVADADTFSLLKGVSGGEGFTEEKLARVSKNLKKAFEGHSIDAVTSVEQIMVLQPLLTDAIRKFKRIDKKIIWKLFSPERKKINDVLKVNNLELRVEHLQILSVKFDNKVKLDKSLKGLFKQLNYFPEEIEYSLDAITLLLNSLENALSAFDLVNSNNQFKLLLEKSTRYKEFNEGLESLLKVSEQANVTYSKTGKWLHVSQISDLYQSEEHQHLLVRELKENFDSIVEYDDLLSQLSNFEKKVFYKSIITVKGDKNDFIKSVANSFYIYWLEELETRFPELKSVSTLKLQQQEEELQRLIRDKQKFTDEIILLKVRELTYKNINFNRLNNRVTYRELKHQVTKKKKIWKLRKIISEFKEEVFDLIPCWLASPETVSAIFPLDQKFDLVVFDEASQCFAEKGIPAIYRGLQIMITGDDKQLQPNDIYQPRWDTEEELHTDQEIDSLLNLGEKYLNQVQLTGHYRSKSIELIAFSNQYFYKNTLKILPDFRYMNNKIPSIQFIKTEGVWENNMNEAEAEKVTELALRLTRVNSNQSIGIVTFNVKQQELISAWLEQRFIEEGLLVPESLFVKNIENVQGDERDVIIFSIAYAPDKKGKMQMQFGSLNQLNGENRLNVAVTRAREKVIVVSSIWPQQLRTDETLHEGPKLLKKYLEYAFEVSNGRFDPSQDIERPFNRRWYLKDKLNELDENLEVNKLPFADLVLHNQDKYKKIYLTDDDFLFNSISSKDFFAYHPLGLQGKNWPFERLFSRSFWLDRAAILEKLKKDREI